MMPLNVSVSILCCKCPYLYLDVNLKWVWPEDFILINVHFDFPAFTHESKKSRMFLLCPMKSESIFKA